MKIFFKKNIIDVIARRVATRQSIIIFLLFLIAFLLRTYSLSWDNNYHLHPDERFLTMVAVDLKLPVSLSQYLNTATSPLNPYNNPSYQFFVYGTFPLFLTKLLAVLLHLDNYNHITLLGRTLSALFDTGNIILLYFIAKKFLKSFYVYLPSFFYAFLVLPLQLSHFFAVDTFLTFFILLTFTLLTDNLFFIAAIAFGLALACKISAIFFVPVIVLFLLKKHLPLKKMLPTLLFTFLTFRLFQPYAFNGLFTLNPLFINNLKTLTFYSNPNIFYPPGIQWINRPIILDSFLNLSIWGLGLTISLPLLFLIFRFFLKPKIKFNLVFMISFWIVLLFIYQSLQFAHTMRYFLPIYPFVCLILAALLFHFKVKKSLIILIIIFNAFSALVFLSLYSRPNSRIQASNWILQNIPQNSVISSEYWDDALPLAYSNYQNISLSFFDPDTPEKWQKINQSLNQIDYLIMSSNRLWASIPRIPDKYPFTSKFYNDLFSKKLNFTLIKKITSYPGISLPFLKSCFYFGPTNYPGISQHWFEKEFNCSYPGIYLRDDTAEEAFTVYDHPQVLIYSKQKSN